MKDEDDVDDEMRGIERDFFEIGKMLDYMSRNINARMSVGKRLWRHTRGRASPRLFIFYCAAPKAGGKWG